MGIENQTSDDESNVEGEVDLEAELISSLEEIKKMQNKEQIFERTIVKIQRRAEIKRRGSQDPPIRAAQFKTTIDAQHERSQKIKIRSC